MIRQSALIIFKVQTTIMFIVTAFNKECARFTCIKGVTKITLWFIHKKRSKEGNNLGRWLQISQFLCFSFLYLFKTVFEFRGLLTNQLDIEIIFLIKFLILLLWLSLIKSNDKQASGRFLFFSYGYGLTLYDPIRFYDNRF